MADVGVVGNLQALVDDAAQEAQKSDAQLKKDFVNQFGDVVDERLEPLTQEEEMIEEAAKLLQNPPQPDDWTVLKTALDEMSEEEQNAIDRKASQLTSDQVNSMTQEEKANLPENWEMQLWAKNMQKIMNEHSSSMLPKTTA